MSMPDDIRKKIGNWLLPHLEDVRRFEIKPGAEGDKLHADANALRSSSAVNRHASEIRKQTTTKQPQS